MNRKKNYKLENKFLGLFYLLNQMNKQANKLKLPKK